MFLCKVMAGFRVDGGGFEIGCNAGVIFVTFLDYVQMPHNTLARQDFPRFARDKLT